MTSPSPLHRTPDAEWRAWHRSASEALLAAATEADVSRAVMYADRSIEAGHESILIAVNDKQRAIGKALIACAHEVRKLSVDD